MESMPQIMQLLEKWDELRESGHEPEIAELCADHPELIAELTDRIQQLKAMDWLDASSEVVQQNSAAMIEVEDKSAAKADIVADRYQLVSQIAAGGFSQVWKAKDRLLGRNVAVKVTTINCHAEARRVAQLKHHGIVTVHDVGNWDGLCFIVFDLIEGLDLAATIGQQDFEWQEAVQMLIKIASSVAFAHEHGFVHRDLKPRASAHSGENS